jgi:peptidoglycan/xylan/chitin deacetylase (PgdA/CDA1 family)
MSGRLASVSLDLDNEWAYLRTRGDPAWEAYPSYLPLVVPRILDVLSHRDLKITVFVVGQDAALDINREPLRAIALGGHEIANHSMQHEPWLHLYSARELEAELESAESSIERATGKRPVGFRGPGYSMSNALLETLASRGYAYDASTLPSFIGPLARAYYFATGKFSKEQRERLARLFGGWREGFQPVKPYRWRLREALLVEVPVTTFPLFRVPIHLSYVHYLAGFSPRLATTYFASAITACRVAGVEPSVLLHPLDFLGGDEVPRMKFFPSMKMPADQKIAVVERCLDILRRHHEVTTVGEHARRASLRPDLPIRTIQVT